MLQDTASARWSTADVDAALNQAIMAAPPMGEYDWMTLTQSVNNWWSFTSTATSTPTVLITEVWIQRLGTLVGPAYIHQLPPDEWSCAINSSEVQVAVPVVVNAISLGYIVQLQAKYLKAPVELSATGDTTAINAAYLTNYAAGTCYIMKSAEAELAEARDAYNKSMYHYQLAQEIKDEMLGRERTPVNNEEA